MSRARATGRTTAQIVRAYRGPALFSFGFRPFFLLAGIFAALAVPIWIAAMSGVAAGPATRDWHVHEMLFGYTGAVIVGYLVIAGANWTGRYPVAGRPIIFLAALWIAGRAAMLAADPGSIAAAATDAAFLVLFAAALWREQIAARNGRNLLPCVIVTLLAAANIAFHLRAAWPPLGPGAERLALGLIALLIAVIGGRLVPSFTRNWIAGRRLGREPAPHGRFDLAVAALTALALLAWQIFPTAMPTALLLMIAGAGTAARLARWRGWTAWREPLVWMLHLGYLWLAAGLALLGLAIAVPETIPLASAIHALTAGAVGGMTLAMMTRTTRSHTGRPRRADRLTTGIYLLINAAALLRVLAPFRPGDYLALLTLAAILWSAAFALFILGYGPMLLAPFRRAGAAQARR